MKAIDYLKQLNILEDKINWYSGESERIRMALLPKGITYDGDKVQTSVSDKVTEDIAKLIDIDRKYIELVRAYHEKREQIIAQIYGLNKKKYIDVLEKIYMDNKPLCVCADEMHYSYATIRHIHGDALKAFGTKYKDFLQAM